MIANDTHTTYREAVEADIPRMVEMGQRFRRESQYADVIAEMPDQMAALGAKLMASPDGICFVIERDGELVGMIGLYAFAHHFTGERTVGELFFWTEPEYRGNGPRLMRAAERWAITQGATTIQMIAPTPDVEVLYQRFGYRALEVAYEKRLSSCL